MIVAARVPAASALSFRVRFRATFVLFEEGKGKRGGLGGGGGGGGGRGGGGGGMGG